MNLDHALIKEHETKSLNEILNLPISALEGLSPRADEAFKTFGVKTVEDLAEFSKLQNDWQSAKLDDKNVT